MPKTTVRDAIQFYERPDAYTMIQCPYCDEPHQVEVAENRQLYVTCVMTRVLVDRNKAPMKFVEGGNVINLDGRREAKAGKKVH